MSQVADVQEESPLNPRAVATPGRARFAANVTTNVFYLACTVAFGMWFTPYLLDHLGAALYGLIPLATSVVSYMTILTQSINSATGRFLTIDLVQGNHEKANQTFNTALFGALLIVCFLTPLVILGAYAAPNVFSVPTGYEGDARWLFTFVGLAFLITAVGSVFVVSAFSCNRFDLQNYAQILRLLVRSGLVVLAFSMLQPAIWIVGASTFVASLFVFGAYVAIWRRLTPQLKVKYRATDRSRFGELFGLGGWVILNQLGALLFVNIDLIVVNMIFGAETAGRYGSVLQLSILLRSLAAAVAGVLTPIVIAKYARGDRDGMVTVSRQAVKFMGLGMALPIGLLCGLAGPFLAIWLGPSFADLDVLLIVLLGHLSLNLAVLPLFPLQMSTNRMRWPGIVTVVMGCLNLGLAIALAKWGPWGAIGVAAAAAVVLTAKNALFTPIYNARIIRLPSWTFLPDLLWGTIAALLIGLATYGIAQLYMPNSWLGLAIVSAIVTVLYAAMAYLVALNRVDRRLLRSLSGLGSKT